MEDAFNSPDYDQSQLDEIDRMVVQAQHDDFEIIFGVPDPSASQLVAITRMEEQAMDDQSMEPFNSPDYDRSQLDEIDRMVAQAQNELEIIFETADATLSQLVTMEEPGTAGTSSADNEQYKCRKCQKVFSRKDNLLRHERRFHNAAHSSQGVQSTKVSRSSCGKLYCKTCNKSYTRRDKLKRHIRTVHNLLDLDHGGKSLQTEPMSQESEDVSESVTDIIMHPIDIESNSIVEDTEPFQDNLDGHNHINIVQSAQIEIRLREDPELFDEIVLPGEDIQDVAYSTMFRNHWGSVRTHHSTERPVQDVYNFRLIELSKTEPGYHTEDALQLVFRKLRVRAKLNVSFGLILRNTVSNELRYFHSSGNNARFFNEPFTIKDIDDIDRLINELGQADIAQHALLQRPDTKWSLEFVTNMTVYVNKLDFIIGASPPMLPPYVSNNKGITTLVKNRTTGRPYTDNLCFYRCLALLNNNNNPKALERATKSLHTMYCNAVGGSVDGMSLGALDEAERLFEVNVQVYTLVQINNHDDVRAELVRRSHRKYGRTLYLNLFANHFSFIHDLSKYSHSYACTKCDRVFKRSNHLKRHEITCDVNVVHRFPGGSYQLPKTVVNKIADLDIVVPNDLQYYPYRATYDFESYFEQVPDNQRAPTEKLKWTSRHELLSCSVASNVPDHQDPVCFVTDGDSAHLVNQVVAHLHDISEAAHSSLLISYSDIFRQLDDVMDREVVQDGKKHPVQYIKEELNAFIRELPVLGFNSGKYDVNIMKRYLYSELQRVDPLEFIVKRTGTYMALKTKKLKFLDITNYLAPGYSYSKFLSAYGVEQQKGFFPYEWLDNLTKLTNDVLPSHAAFSSKLKNANITEEEYLHCQRIWDERNMTTMRDFLIWYNNLDVQPFLLAIEKMVTFYRNLDMDMFKCAISVPGLSLRYLFMTIPEGICFSLIDESNKDLYYKMKANIVGGPSIVFNRYHEENVTNIRNGSNICKRVIGFDANALYLWALMQDMPTGLFVRRNRDDGFKPICSQKYGAMATEWLDWESHCKNVHIVHKFNGVEKRIGTRNIPVDGFCEETHTVFQFHGCYWHGHGCHLGRNQINQIERQEQTKEIATYIRSQGYSLIEMSECAWQLEKSDNTNLKEFVQSRRLPHSKKTRMTECEVVQYIIDGSLFGLVECDIHVPENLLPYFSEMTPIFKNVNISKDDIGEHMRNYAERTGNMKTPRRSLIGSMTGTKILLATPLLQWYIAHGLVVDHVYEVIQYGSASCFRTFGESVSDARRAGDIDPATSIIADTMKLLGNSAYGKTVTNQEKHRKVKVCDDKDAPRYVNDNHFRALHEINQGVYEVELTKHKICLNLPIQIGFFVYQYAKLRMLQFYYDLLDKYIDRAHFEMCEMDTDSAYLAIAGHTLESVIKPDKLAAYFEERNNWFPRNDTPENIAYDKRTPGLFKIEWEGAGIVALCSKTYFCFGATNKVSCKGLNKRTNDITKHRYLDVLRTQTAGSGVNRGFRMKGGHMYTYEQTKSAFTYLYPKRKVDNDGRSTTYLDL